MAFWYKLCHHLLNSSILLIQVWPLMRQKVGKLMEWRRKPMAILQMASGFQKLWIDIRARRSSSCWIGHRLSIIGCQETKSKSQSCYLNYCTIEITLIGKETPYLFMRIGMISNMALEPFVLLFEWWTIPLICGSQKL